MALVRGISARDSGATLVIIARDILREYINPTAVGSGRKIIVKMRRNRVKSFRPRRWGKEAADKAPHVCFGTAIYSAFLPMKGVLAEHESSLPSGPSGTARREPQEDHSPHTTC